MLKTRRDGEKSTGLGMKSSKKCRGHVTLDDDDDDDDRDDISSLWRVTESASAPVTKGPNGVTECAYTPVTKGHTDEPGQTELLVGSALVLKMAVRVVVVGTSL